MSTTIITNTNLPLNSLFIYSRVVSLAQEGVLPVQNEVVLSPDLVTEERDQCELHTGVVVEKDPHLRTGNKRKRNVSRHEYRLRCACFFEL